MSLNLPDFPSSAEQVKERANRDKHLTPTQRIRAVCDAFEAVEKLSRSSGIRDQQLAHWEQQETEWQQIMKRFIEQHAES